MCYPQLIEPQIIPDIFVSGLGEVEDLGDGNFRFTFYCKHHTGAKEELVVVAKLIAPRSAVPPALFMAAKAIGYSMAVGAYFPSIGMN